MDASETGKLQNRKEKLSVNRSDKKAMKDKTG